jgi:3-hydroxyacyl-[acyl-carrier-protein] dehydratase
LDGSVFTFIDQIAEVKRNESLTAFYTLRGDEEFLKDHFEGFPVMPGVLMLEALKQAALALLVFTNEFDKSFYRLTAVEDAKFGQFVKPGSRLKLEARIVRKDGMTSWFEGRIDLEGGPTAKVLTARLALAPTQWSFKEKREYFQRLGGIRR